ncbi:MAG: peptide chain release factor N(5)-glutamine methyltransferase [Christensenellaceae bacterium]
MAKKLPKKPNKTNIGGQAVLEGVMMRGSTTMATAVRDDEGNVRLEAKRIGSGKKPWYAKVPVLRGAVNFFTSLTTGVGVLMRSGEVFGETEPTKFEKWLSKVFKVDVVKIALFLGVALGLGLSVLLFVLSPQWLAEFFTKFTSVSTTSLWFNLVEGVIRMLIFIGYLCFTLLLKDIRRVYQYHGAEHKTISCYERGLPLTVENVRSSSRVHDRCGTTFMFFVMIVSILVFSIANSFLGVQGILRSLVKILFLPIVAGVSYELLKALAKTESWIFYPIKLPGLLLQRITTREPDDGMIEVAIAAFETVLAMDKDKNLPETEFSKPEKVKSLTERLVAEFEKNNIDKSDAEWLVSVYSGVLRSELYSSEKTLKISQVQKIEELKNQRLKGVPLWYLVGNTDFYGRTFSVDNRVLIPRPETEELVYNAIKRINSDSNVLDLCCGSGAIGITVKLETGASVDLSDVSENALEVAVKNAKDLKADVNFILSDMFENISGKYDVIISNPPYVKNSDVETLQREVQFEPKIALCGGEDGYDFYRNVAENGKKFLTENGVLFLECGSGQAQDIADMLKDYKNVEIIKDLNDVERIIKAEL